VQSLFDAHFTALVRFATRRVGDVHLAEDLAAECFVRALKHRDPATISTAWLFLTTRNLIGDTYRRQEREHKLLSTLSAGISETYPHAEEAELLGPLSQLAATDLELLMLLYVDRLPASDVAVILEISVAAVWKRGSRAKMRLRKTIVRTRSEATGGSVISVGLD
jgi:RNA polymerase sigma-70 factor (ECF subfamily)